MGKESWNRKKTGKPKVGLLYSEQKRKKHHTMKVNEKWDIITWAILHNHIDRNILCFNFGGRKKTATHFNISECSAKRLLNAFRAQHPQEVVNEHHVDSDSDDSGDDFHNENDLEVNLSPKHHLSGRHTKCTPEIWNVISKFNVIVI